MTRTPPHASAGIAHAVGRLEGEISALKEEMARDRTERQRDEENARQHRRDLRDVMGALSGSVQELARQVAEAKPLWQDYQERRAEARGAAKLVKVVYGAIAAAAGAGGAMIVQLFTHRP